MIDVALIGTGGMIPLPNRFLTSLCCRINGRYIMIDCGEGTQVSLKILGWSLKNLDIICFTHFHADHIAGLPGILLTAGNCQRTEPIYIIGPNGTKTIVKNLCSIAPELPFDLIIIEQNDLLGENFQMNDYFINILPVEHSLNCLAYSIYLPRKGKFNPAKALEFDIPQKFWSMLQNGQKIEYSEKIFEPALVLGNERRGIKISYCTDSRPVTTLTNFVRGSDLFICEGIYGENERLDKAIANKHMIFSEAATIAKNADVKELWLTHFSPSMPEPQKYLNFATDIFPNTIIGQDRMHKTIFFP